MRFLPLALTRGPLLSQVMREAQQDPRGRILCACCGAPIHLRRDRPEVEVRCPACLRLQPMDAAAETPWRLTDTSAEALRRIKSWPRTYWPNR